MKPDWEEEVLTLSSDNLGQRKVHWKGEKIDVERLESDPEH
jgi:hypothetical protein